MVRSFRHVCVVVNDINKSLKFYRDILGLKVAKVQTIEGKYPETVLNVKGIKLTYVKMHDPAQPRLSPPVFELHCWRRPKITSKKGYDHISFTVKDIDREYERLAMLGVKFISRPTKAPDAKTKICFGYDPDGHLIEFVEEFR